MAEALRDQVRLRAGGICEYCHLSEEYATFRFQLDRIVAGQHGGTYTFENCAWCCPECNHHKLSNLSGVDPNTQTKQWLFNPREDTWADHFQWQGAELVGTTAVGRATVELLQINAPHRMRTRADLMTAGKFPA